jgi:hypothetical protein
MGRFEYKSTQFFPFRNSAEREGLAAPATALLADPLEGGLRPNRCPFASLTPIFVFRIRIEQARPSAANKNAPPKGGDIVSVLRRGRDSNPRYKFKLV